MKSWAKLSICCVCIVGSASAAVACDTLNITLSGTLPMAASVMSADRATLDAPQRSYPVPLHLIGITGEEARLLFTRVTESTWRVDVLMNTSEDLSPASLSRITLKERPAATLVQLSDEGLQVGEQSVVLMPTGGVSQQSGSMVRIALRGFRSTDAANVGFESEYSMEPNASCAWSRRIVSIKTKPDSARDELNPINLIEEAMEK